MTFQEAKVKLAAMAGDNKYHLDYAETENWGYPTTLVSITMLIGDAYCVIGNTYEDALAQMETKLHDTVQVDQGEVGNEQ